MIGCANVHKMIITDRSIGLNSGLVTTCYHCIEQSFPKFVISMCFNILLWHKANIICLFKYTSNI